jgi:hypothetical protein
VPRDMEQDPSLAAGLSDEEAQLLAGCAKGRVTIKPWEKAGPANFALRACPPCFQSLEISQRP